MLRPILFRGGMFGDLILGMLDPTALQKKSIYQKNYKKNTVGGYHIKYTRTQQKKFSNYTQIKKEIYYSRFMKFERDVYIVTHDTDFSKNYPDQTIQLVCSDQTILTKFAERFHRLHRKQVSDEAKTYLKEDTGDFVSDYAQDILRWQDFHKFKHRFDIRNIYNEQQFLQDFDRAFPQADPVWSHQLYKEHFEQDNIW